MARVSSIVTNFKAGEFSPRLEGRIDLRKYNEGAQTLQNMVVYPQGGATRRPGTKFIGTTKNNGKARLINFEFSDDQTYVMEFGANYIRFITDEEPLLSGGSPVEVSTSYSVTDVFELNFVQSADVIFIVHKDHPPAKLTRTTVTSFTFTEIDFEDGPYLDENATNTTIFASSATGSNITLTASTSIFESGHVGALFRFREVVAANHPQWEAGESYAQGNTVVSNNNVYEKTNSGTTTSGDVAPVHLEGNETYSDGIQWTFLHDGAGYVKIKTVSGTTATAQVESRLPASVVGSGNATLKWSEGAFSEKRGFPRAIAFYEERLFLAGTSSQPQTIFGSVTDDFENHSPGLEDDDAVNVTIASDKVNVIKHLLPARFLQILTTSAEFTLSGGTGLEAVTPTNVNVLRETTFGTSATRPLRAAASTIMVQKGGEKVKEVTFDESTDGLVGIDLTILAEHLTRGGISAMEWQQEPELLLWFVRNDGLLVGLSYDRANDTIGWHSHPLGANSSGAIVESITSIPSGSEDQIYLSVKRTINGTVTRTIEALSVFEFGEDVADAYFVDCGITYSGSATSSISGLDHLEGETVQVLADGATHPDVTVSSGSVTLDRQVTKAHIGYSFDSIVETLRMEAGANDGIAQGKIKRIHGVTVRFLKTVGAEIGPDLNNLDRLPFRDSSMSMDVAVPLFTGDKEISFPSGYDDDAQVVVRQTQPLPMTVLAVMRRSNTFDA